MEIWIEATPQKDKAQSITIFKQNEPKHHDRPYCLQSYFPFEDRYGEAKYYVDPQDAVNEMAIDGVTLIRMEQS